MPSVYEHSRPATQPIASWFPSRAGSSLRRKCSCSGQAAPRGECAECKKKEEATPQRRSTSAAGPGTAPPIVHDVLRSPGQPLDVSTRAFFEPSFDHDFSKVRVHADAKAAESARAVNANAYTVGNNIVFASRPSVMSASESRRLMAHELTHVVQQSNASASAAGLSIGDARSPLELEADRAAEAIASDFATVPLTRSSGQSVQRDSSPAQKPTATQSQRCQPATTDPAEKGLWQGFFQQALQGVAGNEKFKTPQAKADAACEVANFSMVNLLPRHNKQVECAVKDVPDSTNAPKQVYPNIDATARTSHKRDHDA